MTRRSESFQLAGLKLAGRRLLSNESEVMRQPKGESNAIDFLQRLEEPGLLQGPELRRRGTGPRDGEQAVHRASAGFVRRLHAGDVCISADVIRRDEEVLELHLGLRP